MRYINLHLPYHTIYELDPYFLEIYRMFKYELPSYVKASKLSSDRQTDRQTDEQTARQTRPKLYTTPLRGWSVATRLRFNLRPTTRECVHLVLRGHFRSRDKDGGHIIPSAISENPMLHANFMALYFIVPELLTVEVLHCGIIDFRLFCSCDFDLDPMTSIYEFKL